MLFMKKFTICFILPVSFVIWIMYHRLQLNNIKNSSKCISHANKTEDSINRLLPVEKQLQWLVDIGFVDVHCYWKWLVFALLVGYKV